jgi:hypothetical protein
MKPFTVDLIKKTPLLYRGAANVHSGDVDDALNGLKHEVTMMMDVDEDVKRLLFHHIDTWFPAFSTEDDENTQT